MEGYKMTPTEIFNALMLDKKVKIAFPDVTAAEMFRTNFSNFVSRQRKALEAIGASEEIGMVRFRLLTSETESVIKMLVWLERREKEYDAVILE